MERIQVQAAKLWNLVFGAETGDIYKQAVSRTWEIIQEAAKLVWLVICITFVFLAWGWIFSFHLGRKSRTWYESLEEPKVTHILPETGKALLSAGTTSATFAISQAKSQVGIEDEPEALKAITSQAELPPKKEDVLTLPGAKTVTQETEDVSLI